ncbi:sigma-70 family RNA polymerase sigma factor [Planctomicrobium piriforme]|uniref:RNA polymerase sigma-70 factor, ECF subfamily n=1 Tax=Planctomicrobium piriforme TaxID=1576369 RepID=A0A1I3MZA7_9PLAN|nr:sigma-70 family RNA polymerase sigma factor [Planctomicrobium piriforme]SFJ02454.1 RNA polymerase sigma-70 factor, ECF subfamily [Planctomicrobium piriforme]
MLRREEATAILLEERLSLTAFVNTIVRSFHLAEDIYQDVCVKSLLREEQFEAKAQLLKWARVSCRNRAIDVIRARDGKYEGISEEALETLLAVWSDEDDGESLPARDALAYCLGELTPNNRRILQLRYFEGRSGIEVAEFLGRKPTAVYQALARIHSMLERCIQMRLDLGGGGVS